MASNLLDVGQIRSSRGTSMKMMMKPEALEGEGFVSCKFGGVRYSGGEGAYIARAAMMMTTGWRRLVNIAEIPVAKQRTIDKIPSLISLLSVQFSHCTPQRSSSSFLQGIPDARRKNLTIVRRCLSPKSVQALPSYPS